MNKTIKIALAGMFAASSMSGIALAQTAAAPAPATTMSETEGVSVVRIDTLQQGNREADYQRLMELSKNEAEMQKAQAEVTADAKISSQLESQGVTLANVVWVETAANGGKIVYVK